MDKKDRLICIFLFLGFLGAGLIAALQLNIPPVLDEVGILANSAYASGYDWTETTYTMGGFYYKYGISLLYAPFLKLIDDPYVLYKALLSFNVLLYAFIPVIAYTILRKHLKTERLFAGLVASVSTLVPCCFIFQLYAKADSMLIFLPWVVLYIILELNATKTGNKKAVLSFLLSFVCIYSFAVHTRGLVIIIATVLTLLLMWFFTRKCPVNIPMFLGSAIAFLAIDRLLVKVFYDGVYGIYGTAHASAESFEFDYLLKIFTSDGLKTVGRLVTGWLFTGLTATCGLIGVAVLGGIIYFFKELKRKPWKKAKFEIKSPATGNNTDPDVIAENAERAFSVYSVLSLLGVFAMGILFFFPPVHRYFTETAVMRSDRIIYERYIAAAFGPAVMYGLYVLLGKRAGKSEKSENDKKSISGPIALRVVTGVLFLGVIVIFLSKCVKYIEGVKGCARYFIGISEFLNVEGGATNAAFEGISDSFLYAAILGFGVFVIISVITIFVKAKEKLPTEKEKTGKTGTYGFVATCAITFAVFAFITIVTFNKIRLSRDTALVGWTENASQLLNNLPEEARQYPIFWDVSAKDIKHYQFLLKDYRIGSYCTVTKNAENCFVIAQKRHYLKEYYEDDYYSFDSFDYENSRDMVYVKGEKLAGYLKNAGYSLTKFEGRLRKAELPVQQVMPYVEP